MHNIDGNIRPGLDSNPVTLSFEPQDRAIGPNVGSMLGQRRRRWTKINATAVHCFFIAGVYVVRMYI